MDQDLIELNDIIGEENDDDHDVGNRSGSLGETWELGAKMRRIGTGIAFEHV